MYRKRKGRPGRWLAVLLIICGLGGIYWMTRTGPSSLQADGDEPTILTLNGGTASEGSSARQGNPSFVNDRQAPEPVVEVVEEPIQFTNDDAFEKNETTTEIRDLREEVAPGIFSEIETPSPEMDAARSPYGASGNPTLSEYTSLASTDPISARAGLTSLIASGSLGSQDLVSARAELNELGRILFFDPSSLPNDPFVARYTVSSGDSLSRIAQRGQISADWRIIQRLNNLRNPNAIRIGQSLKVPDGTFHAVVHKSDYTMDLYLENETGKVIIASYPVGLGAYDGTPTGRFVVRTNSRLVNPQWTNPRTGEFFYADDPENPIGERWIGLKGIDPENEDLLGYGIHGTIDPDSIGDMRSMGCIRLRDEDVQIIYEALTEQGSQITILP